MPVVYLYICTLADVPNQQFCIAAAVDALILCFLHLMTLTLQLITSSLL